jgi:integrase
VSRELDFRALRGRELPIAPEFALPLLETPEEARTGTVFHLEGRQGRYRDWEVSKIVSKIGKAAGVKVYVNPKDPEKVKYASAHDFRRAFGVRWAARLMPAQLMKLMRHESIETNLRFYGGTDARADGRGGVGGVRCGPAGVRGAVC